MTQDRELTLIEHLRELRDRLIRASIALVVCTMFSFVFTSRFLRVLIAPMENIQPIFTRPTEMFTTYMKVALISGLALSMPVIAYEAIRFIMPALLPHERRYIYLLVPGATVSFLAGLAFAYFAMIPVAVRYLLTFGGDIARAQWRIGEYISFITTLLIGVGIVFELPLVIYFLAKLHIITYKTLIGYWKLAVILILVAAAIITPTGDPFNMAIVALPLAFLYLIGILLARIA